MNIFRQFLNQAENWKGQQVKVFSSNGQVRDGKITKVLNDSFILETHEGKEILINAKQVYSIEK